MRRRHLLSLAGAAALAGWATASPMALDDDNQRALVRVQDYLDGLRTMRATVLQFAANGAESQGTVWMQRPGRLRLDYDPPHPAVLLVNNGQLVLHDAT